MSTFLDSDPIDLRLDDDDDLFVGPRGFEIVTGAEGVGQLCKIALRLFLAEWFLDQSKGMPWFQEILAHKFSRDVASARAAEVLIAVPGVDAVLSVSASFDNQARKAHIDATVSTSFGIVDVTAAVTASVGGSSG